MTRRILATADRRGYYSARGYQTASVLTTHDGYIAPSGSGESLAEYDRSTLQRLSRAFYRNNEIYKGIVDSAVRYTVGSGFQLKCRADDPQAAARVEAAWNTWWKDPEVRHCLDGPALLEMICREEIIAGDSGSILTNKRLVQIVEAEQIAAKTPTDGIRKDAYGAPQGFYVCPYGRGGYIDYAKKAYYAAKSFVFVSNQERPSSLRGIPAAQAAFPMLHRIGDVIDSEAISAQLQARMALAVTRELGPMLGQAESTPDPALEGKDGQADTRFAETGYALIAHLQPGEKVEPIQRSAPSSQFVGSVKFFLRILGLPLGLPLEILLLDWTGSNYSQSRGAIIQAGVNFSRRQQRLWRQALDPIFEWWLANAVRSGEVAAADAPAAEGHSWIAPSFPWLDLGQEADANALMIETGMTTLDQVCHSLNRDRGAVLAGRKREIAEAIGVAKELEAAHGVKVPVGVPGGSQAAADPGRARPAEEQRRQPGTADHRRREMSAIIDYICSTAWALDPAVYERMMEIVFRHAEGARLSAEEVEAATGGRGQAQAQYRIEGGVAVIPVTGIIAKHASQVGGLSQPRGTSTERVGAMLAEALSSDEVRAVLLDIESPGGTVDGIAELSDAIYAARSQKPVWAFVNDSAASAAYFLASQATRVYSTQMARVGSIGIYTALLDVSRWYENAGAKVHLVRTSPLKGAGFQGTHVTPEQISAVQREVDDLFAVFRSHVMRGRGMSEEAFAAVGDASVFVGKEAAAVGLTDGVKSIAEVLAELGASRPARAAAGSQTRKGAHMAEDQVVPQEVDVETVKADAAAQARAAERERLDALCAAFPADKEFALEQYRLGADVAGAKVVRCDALEAKVQALEGEKAELVARVAALETEVKAAKQAASGAEPIAAGDGPGDARQFATLAEAAAFVRERDGLKTDTAATRKAAKEFPGLR